MRWMFASITIFLSVAYAQINFVSDNKLTTYDYETIKQWLNSYPYLYKGFTPNRGQLATTEGKPANEVIFYSFNGNMGIFITEKGLSYVIYVIEKKESYKKGNYEGNFSFDELWRKKVENEGAIVHYARIDYDLMGANIKRENIVYEDELPGYTNYYLAHCPDGILFVKSYRKVRIKDIYPGIDWVFRYDDEGNFHHEFEIMPNANIAQIKIDIKYADIELLDGGEIISLKTPLGEIRDNLLSAYEGIKRVDVSYKSDNNLLSFDVKGYERKDKLVIDPYSLVWSTLYGGAGTPSLQDNTDECYFYGCDVKADPYGNIFVGGGTRAYNFPTYNPGGGAYFDGSLNGIEDGFILKFTNNGVRLWATYYGGGGQEEPWEIAVDRKGHVVATGETCSGDMPLYNPGGGAYFQGPGSAGCGADGWDGFIWKFDNNGVRIWATYIGGGTAESGFSVATDYARNVFIVGSSRSTNFPTYNPGGGAYYQTCPSVMAPYIMKFDSNGVLKWSTCYGGRGWGISVATDIYGNVFLTGQGASNIPTYNPGGGAYYQPCPNILSTFIVKFNNNGIRLWATCYSDNITMSRPWSITTDKYGNVFLTGYANAAAFPVYDPGNGAYFQGNGPRGYDAYIIKFNNNGVRLWATLYGGTGNENRTDYDHLSPSGQITTDAAGNVFVTGFTTSNDFPTYNPGGGAYYDGICGANGNCSGCYWDPNLGDYICGPHDAFVLAFNNNGVRLWATYFGGGGWVKGTGIAASPAGGLFLVGHGGVPLVNPGGGAYFQTTYENGTVFISKFDNPVTPISIDEGTYSISKNYLSFNLEPSNKPMTIKIYSIDGKLILSKSYNATNSIRLDISSLKRGVYIVNVYSGEIRVINAKFVKE